MLNNYLDFDKYANDYDNGLSTINFSFLNKSRIFERHSSYCGYKNFGRVIEV